MNLTRYVCTYKILLKIMFKGITMKNILFALLMLMSSVSMASHCGGNHDDHSGTEGHEKEKTEHDQSHDHDSSEEA